MFKSFNIIKINTYAIGEMIANLKRAVSFSTVAHHAKHLQASFV